MRIVVVCPSRSTFIERDIEILSTQHDVTVDLISPGALDVWPWRHREKFANSDLAFFWFASLRAMSRAQMARWLRIPILIAVGGYEAARVPELNYGSALKTTNRLLTQRLLRMASMVLTGSNSSATEVNANYSVDPARHRMIYYGLHDLAASIQAIKKPVVLTVGAISNSNWRRKGQQEFFELAARMRDIEFWHVGKIEIDPVAALGKILPGNVRLLGALPDADLYRIYAEAAVYLQLSRHEGFGYAVAESMLFRCVPVATNVFSLPEVVGDAGWLVPPGDLEAAEAAARRALDQSSQIGEAARMRILTEFSFNKRRQLLLDLVKHVAAAQR